MSPNKAILFIFHFELFKWSFRDPEWSKSIIRLYSYGYETAVSNIDLINNYFYIYDTAVRCLPTHHRANLHGFSHIILGPIQRSRLYCLRRSLGTPSTTYTQ